MSILTRRQRERTQRREAILVAAREVFFARGFSNATMGQIAQAAELSKGTLYLYFESKDDLFLALCAQELEGLATRFESIAQEQAPGLTRVEKLLHAYADRAASKPLHFRAVTESIVSGHAVDASTASLASHQALVRRVVGNVVACLDAGKQDGTVRADLDSQQAATQLWGGMFGVLILRLRSEEIHKRAAQAVDFDALVPGFIELLCSGLRPKENLS